MRKALDIPELSKELSLKGSGEKEKKKKGFQEQSFTRYLRLTLVFMWNSALRGKFNICFS